MLGGGKVTKYSKASQPIPIVERSATSHSVSLRPDLSMFFPVEHSMSDYTQARKIQNLRKVSRSKADMCGATRDFRFGQKRTFRGRRSVSALSPEAYAERTLHCIRVDMRGLGYRSAVSLPAPASVHPATTAWQSCR